MDDRRARRIREELEHHIDALTAQLEREGFEAAEARREALRRFGDPEGVARATRAAGPAAVHGLSGGLSGDLVQALRSLRRAPAFAAAVTATLTLALGATIAVAGVVWDVLLRPLDVVKPETLVALTERHAATRTERMPTSYGTFQEWRRDLRTVDAVVGWEWASRTLEDPERPEELPAAKVSGDFFAVLGIAPALGRSFGPDEESVDAPATVVMLGHDFWTRRLGADPDVVGRRLPVDGQFVEIVGVLPARLDLFPDPPALFVPDAFVPLDPTNRGGRVVHVVARLSPGSTPAAADAEVAALAERIAEAEPSSARGWSATARPLGDHLLGEARGPMGVALAGAALLLLVGALNVTNLLLVRASDGAREMAVRAALGAGRRRLVRLGLVEAGVLGGVGGALGVGFASAVLRWLSAAEPGVLPRALDAGLPAVVLAFGALLAGILALAVGVAPALRAADGALGALGRGARGAESKAGSRGRRMLVVVQLALTVVLLVGAGLLVRTVEALRGVDVGYEPEGVVAARVLLDPVRYPSRTSQRAYFDALVERVRAIPGVREAGITSALPMDPVSANFDLPTRSDRLEGVDWGEVPQADFRIMGPGAMEALGFRLLEGRTLTPGDGAGSRPVALVNRGLSELFWPGEDAVGRRIESIWRQGQWFEVVGVVEDTRFYGPTEAPRPELFVPHAQIAWHFMTVVARGALGPASLEAALERAVVETDPLLPPQDVFPVDELVRAATATQRFYAVLLTGFAALALALAAAGVYGVLAYAVRLRTRELGVRLALGARRGEVVGMVVRQGIGMAAAGVAAGALASIPATRVVAGMLFGVDPLDPLTLGGVGVLLGVVAAAACLQPALRAARLDPARVLREE